jgi:polysaccharide export outer membrane protein
MIPKKSFLIFCSAITLLLFSCTSTKKVIYFNDLTAADSAQIAQAQSSFEAPIQKNDQLWITVGGSNIADLAVLNSAGGTAVPMLSSATGAILGYLVEADGSIKIPYVGKIKAEGLTRVQLENLLTDKFKDFTKNPVVNVRYLNYYVSILGEVARPGKINLSTERITILEAISNAGDITFLGRSDNVMVIREENGQRQIGRVNLLSKSLFSSPFFYLKTNDVIYVEPVKAKFISRAGIPQYISIIAVGLSLILTIINLKK